MTNYSRLTSGSDFIAGRPEAGIGDIEKNDYLIFYDVSEYSLKKVKIDTISLQSLGGAQGLQGIQGLQGVQGIQGIQGIQGLIGVQGLQGVQGVQGSQGTQGTTGTVGPNLLGNLNLNSYNITDSSGTSNITIGGNLTATQFLGTVKGSVVSNANSILVDGAQGKIELSGTVKGHIIPDQNLQYDLGSSSFRFRDLYLSGSTINLGNASISASSGAIQLPVGSTVGGVTVGISSRQLLSVTSSSLVNGSSSNLNLVGYKTYAILQIGASVPSRIRVYSSSAERTADAGRSQITDPIPGSGVIAEVIIHDGLSSTLITNAKTQNMTPVQIGYNAEGSNIIFIAVQNQSGINQSVTVYLRVVPLES
jgi:hypothetical protein